MKRILVGGMSHESNTLNPIITGPEDFRVQRGEEILSSGLSPHYSITGIVKTLQAAGCDLVPALVARAVPNGVIDRTFYAGLKAEFLERTRLALETGPIDGICLALHGSMKVQGIGCAEEDLAVSLRRLLPGVPFTAALDMHATVTPGLLTHIDGFAGYKTAPHIDCRETGDRAAGILLASLASGRRPRTAYRRIPMIVAGEKSESETEPMLSLIDRCRRAESREGILAASILLGFPWADEKHNAVSVLVTTLEGEKDEAEAETVAESIAAEFWARRKDFVFRAEHYDSEEAVRRAFHAALDEGQKPVFLSDSGDNPTAGATGDATELFEKVLANLDLADKLPTLLLYSGFYDAKAVADCIACGPGGWTDITIGGTWDTLNGKKIPLKVFVHTVVRNYGTFGADLVAVSFRNLLIVLTSKHIGFGDGELLPTLGIKAEDHHIVVVKLGYLEPCFRTIAARAILATSHGCSNEILESIPFKNLTRPLYPLDPDMERT